MSMAVGDRDENEPMMDMNTTPLIDVMLVLLIMFIITIPVQTHAVKIDLPIPTDSKSNVDPEKNKVMIDPAGTITWNGSPVDLAQLALVLGQIDRLLLLFLPLLLEAAFLFALGFELRPLGAPVEPPAADDDGEEDRDEESYPRQQRPLARIVGIQALEIPHQALVIPAPDLLH